MVSERASVRRGRKETIPSDSHAFGYFPGKTTKPPSATPRQKKKHPSTTTFADEHRRNADMTEQMRKTPGKSNI